MNNKHWYGMLTKNCLMNSRLLSAGCWIWWLCLWLVTTGFSGPIEHVIIVSMDGARPDYVLSAQASNIQAMAAQGAFTWWAQTVNPSVTLISHTSMLSGCQPAKHGIDWNTWKPSKGFIKTNTCFELVKKSGGRTAMFVGKAKLRHIAKPDTVDTFESVEGPAMTISTAAAVYFKTNQPDLLFVHYPDPDAAGHAFGWGAAPYLAAIKDCDQGIGLLRIGVEQAGLADRTLFIITADHGGHQRSHGTKDVRDMTIPWVAYSPGNVIPGEIQTGISTCDTAATAVYALGLKVDPQWDGKAAEEIFADGKAAGVRKRQMAK
ncbi:MAG: alkaline phosphatase family protein [Kiritimatiellae bacterium]|nr:alkaline phosphatase family protein [Kiritimatiellia bacterium]